MIRGRQKGAFIIIADDDENQLPKSVIEKSIIPEPHVLMGVVNHTYCNSLVPIIGDENAAKKIGVIPITDTNMKAMNAENY